MQYGNPGGPPGSLGNPGGPPGSMMQHPGQGGPSPFDGMSSPPDMQASSIMYYSNPLGAPLEVWETLWGPPW